MVKASKGLKAAQGTYLALLLSFLYAPIAVMIIFSFNASKSRGAWGGFSLKWYLELFKDPQILAALIVTLKVAVLASICATILGTLAAIGLYAMKKGIWKNTMFNMTYLPMTTPDIVMGVSLMVLFLFVRMELGFFTMLLAHIAFNTPYVIFAVLPKLKQMNQNLYEAALDLGCTPIRALYKVILPEILPGVITGALLAFTMSLDDFVISFFTTSTEVNLSILIYSMARRGVKPTINALSAIMFVVILILLIVVNKRESLEDV